MTTITKPVQRTTSPSTTAGPAGAAAPGTATNGVAVDCRSHWKARIGRFAVSFAKREGGAFAIGLDGPESARPSDGMSQVLLRFAARAKLVCTSDPSHHDHGRSVFLRQENDPAPKFHFLEEGPVRVGVRIAFDLLDDAGHYHGDGRADVWLYPEGDVHVTYSIEIIDRLGHGPVSDIYLEVMSADGPKEIQLGSKRIAPGTGQSETLAFGAALPEKAAFVRGGPLAAALYWVRDAGPPWQYGCDHGPIPPYYASRWPTGMQQWCRFLGWTPDAAPANLAARAVAIPSGAEAGSAVTAGFDGSRANLRFAWLRDAAAEGDPSVGASLIVSLAESEDELRRRVQAAQNALKPEVVGGTFRCYTEEDGLYEVGQTDPTGVRITFPADPLERVARVRYYRRKTDPRHRGAIVATANGKPLRMNLVSEGELTDDICVVMEMTPRTDSVDDVIVSTRLDAKRPTEIVIDKVPGIQAVYESEISGVDLQRRAGNRRDVVVWSTRCRHKPLLELDLFNSAVHRVNAPTAAAPAIFEVPMAWFRSCGHSKHQYCNDLKAFAIEKNGPDEVKLYARATNPNGRAQSELWLRVPYEHPRLRLEVKMRMECLEGWDYNNVEFSDIFPFSSRLVETWFHDQVLFVQRDRSWVHFTRRPDKNTSVPPPAPDRKDDRLFYALFPNERGNVLTLVKKVTPAIEPLHTAVCGNYIDIHLHLRPRTAPVPKGSVFEVEYVTEILCDAAISPAELKQIGLRSLEAGELVI